MPDLPQLEAIRAWLDGDEHADHDTFAMGREFAAALVADVDRHRLAMAKLNRLRSNVIATQNCSWSNTTYTIVAILNEAGYELLGATDEQTAEHLACYGGAGKTPRHLDETPAPESLLDDLALNRRRADAARMTGSVLIHAERWRQQDEEGWTPEHDDDHTGAELIQAAVAYALAATPDSPCSEDEPADFAVNWWPWDQTWWKPSDDPIPNLVKAGALLAAEIDRLQRDA